MYYIVYQTSNKVNGKIYIGSHKTSDLHDEYIGSGKLLSNAIEKYGKENFSKDILHIFDNPTDMYEMEKKLVNKEFVLREDTYNMKIGGFGGWDHVDNTNRILSEETHKKMSASAKIRQTGKTNSFYGKKHSAESLDKIGKASKARGKTIYEKRMLDGNHPNSFGSCPHCGKYGQLRAMKRWHFDKCTNRTSQ